MARAAIALGILAVVVTVALVLQRRKPEAPPRDAYPVPQQLDRTDFPRPDAPWLVALFSSAACDSCRELPERLAAVESAEVATCEIEASARGDLHRRYAIAAIPTTVVADAHGVVRRSFVGAFTASDLEHALTVLASQDPV